MWKIKKEYSEIKKLEQRKKLEKASDFPEIFHEFIKSKSSVKEKIIRWKDSEGWVVDEEKETFDGLNAKFQSLFYGGKHIAPNTNEMK